MYKLFLSSCVVSFYHHIFINSRPKLGCKLNFYLPFQCSNKENWDPNICHNNTAIWVKSSLILVSQNSIFYQGTTGSSKLSVFPETVTWCLLDPWYLRYFTLWERVCLPLKGQHVSSIPSRSQGMHV